ncbi:hypothetical protein K457DRAFT_27398 [Linnemannia elongata AG-77]|uniref:Crinkler effector protein N-terminal domain-containing protein n=1 Tax=Linnemannia elongata AG-77 TaxID=1314771 RepID=A0A197KH92_9FUNG|nr:hypothetical protein K457DRAFT_27398 [Linnemannia elongata AG-77]
MLDNRLNLFCLVDGESTSNAFPVGIEPTNTIGDLKEFIKVKKTPEFNDIAADKLTLWRVSIPITDDDDEVPLLLNNVTDKDKKKLGPATRLSKVFLDSLPEETINVIVQRPPPVHAPGPARGSSPLSGHLLDDSRSGMTPSGDLRANIKRITDKFFAPGSDAAELLDPFVRGLKNLPLTTGSVSGLPRVWPRNNGPPADTCPSLLFSDLPHPSSSDIESRYPTSDAILQFIEKCSTPIVPIFGVSGCGKTRGIIELLSRRWGFYFNASEDDLGSNDVVTLIRRIKSRLQQDREANNRQARTMSFLLSRLKMLQYCLMVSAFLPLLPLYPTSFTETDLETATQEEFLTTKYLLVQYGRQGGLPSFKDRDKLFVAYDEAQILGEMEYGRFESLSQGKPDRPLLSPILWGFRNIAEDSLTHITSGTGLSIYTLDWVYNSGVFNKQTAPVTGKLNGYKYMDFPDWAGRQSIEAYVADLRDLLPTEDAKQALVRLLPPEAIQAITERIIGRYRPVFSTIEKIIARGEPSGWRDAVDDTEVRLVSYDYRTEQGNLCHEIVRLENKYRESLSICKELRTVEVVLGLLLFQRYMFGADKLVLQEAVPELVERAFGRIKIVDGAARTFLDEPFVLKAAENYFKEKDSGFMKTAEWWVQQSDRAQAHGYAWELMMMSVLTEAFKTRTLSNWPNEPSILFQCEELAGIAVIVGLDEHVLQRGISYEHISMKGFMDAHIYNGSMRDDRAVPPFFFPKAKPSGPDIVFIIRVKENLLPVFVQLKLRQTLATSAIKAALKTMSAPAIETHVEDLGRFCPTHTYISMIVAYPATVVSKLPFRPDPVYVYNLRPRPEGKHKRLTQVKVMIDSSNIREIFPQSHVDFLDGIKDPMKWQVVDNMEVDSSKKTRKKKIV